MRARSEIIGIVVFILLSVVTLKIAAQVETPKQIAIKCGQLIDGRSDRATRNAIVLIEGERIARVGTDIAIPSDAQLIDLGQATVLPGLIDCHTHLTYHPGDIDRAVLEESHALQALYGAAHAKATLEAGFTTVRNVGAEGYTDVALRDAIEKGLVPGPRMLVSGPALGITGGHCDINILAPHIPLTRDGVADGVAEVRKAVRRNIKYGVDLIKICATGGVMSKGDMPGTAQYTLEEMRAAVEEAARAGRKVAAHAHGAQGIKDAIRSGVASIEHGSMLDDEALSMLLEREVFLVPNPYASLYIINEGKKAGIPDYAIQKSRQIYDMKMESLRKAIKAGAPIAFGTDAAIFPHGENARQFALLVKEGMSPMGAIRSATSVAAQLLGMYDRIGTIAEGKWADIIAVSGDPLSDITELERIRFVMKGGRIIKNQILQNHIGSR